MKHLVFALSMGAAILTAATTSAMVPSNGGLPPAPLDHMVCYSMRDPLKIQAHADFLAQLQPEFSQDGCILLKAIEFCVPASKSTKAALDPNIRGADLSNDYICYKAKCPNLVPPPNKMVIDQFGERLEQNYKLTKICVPARKRPAGCPVGPIVKGGPVCTGACPSPTQLCKTANGQCSCVDQTGCTARPDAAGQCGGPCPPDPATGEPQICLADRFSATNPTAATLPLVCRCQTRPRPWCGINELTGQCGGKCENPTDSCVFVVDPLTGKEICGCAPQNPPCQAVPNPVPPGGFTCGGDCPPGLSCANDATTGKCSCQGSGDQCVQNPFTGKCDGGCLDPKKLCSLDSTGHCLCQEATTCGSVTTTNPDGTITTTCGGPCPTGDVCKADATGACNCQPDTTLPCQSPDGQGLCGGVCPAQTVCLATSPTTCDCVPQAQECRTGPAPCGGLCQSVNATCSQTPGTTSCGCNLLCHPAGGPCTTDADCCSNICNGTPNGVCQ